MSFVSLLQHWRDLYPLDTSDFWLSECIQDITVGPRSGPCATSEVVHHKRFQLDNILSLPIDRSRGSRCRSEKTENPQINASHYTVLAPTPGAVLLAHQPDTDDASGDQLNYESSLKHGLDLIKQTLFCLIINQGGCNIKKSSLKPGLLFNCWMFPEGCSQNWRFYRAYKNSAPSTAQFHAEDRRVR